MHSCPNCGEPFHPGTEYCDMCNHRIADQTHGATYRAECPNCGERVHGGDEYCANCNCRIAGRTLVACDRCDGRGWIGDPAAPFPCLACDSSGNRRV
ncbi:MAG: double zinc ribbon domain-containing protein [Planctomycetota bacterium]